MRQKLLQHSSTQHETPDCTQHSIPKGVIPGTPVSDAVQKASDPEQEALLEKGIERIDVWLHGACFDGLPCLTHCVRIACLYSLRTQGINHWMMCLN